MSSTENLVDGGQSNDEIRGDEPQKKRVIRSLFALRLLQKQTSFEVSLSDVQAAIRRANARWEKLGAGTLSDGNPANFFKDIVRREQAYRIAWPYSVLRRGFIGVQVKGRQNSVANAAQKRTSKGAGPCFAFVHTDSEDPIFDLYQAIPTFLRPEPSSTVPTFSIQTLELPPEVRRLRREDESFLLQLVVRLRVIETHLAAASQKNLDSLVHLQMGLKTHGAEIDGLFLGELDGTSPNKPRTTDKRRVLVALEAKGRSDDILKSQLVDQVKALFALKTFQDEIDLIVPMAVKLIAPSRLYVAEYDFVERNEVVTNGLQLANLRISGEAFYEFVPPLGGVREPRKLKSRAVKRSTSAV